MTAVDNLRLVSVKSETKCKWYNHPEPVLSFTSSDFRNTKLIFGVRGWGILGSVWVFVVFIWFGCFYFIYLYFFLSRWRFRTKILPLYMFIKSQLSKTDLWIKNSSTQFPTAFWPSCNLNAKYHWRNAKAFSLLTKQCPKPAPGGIHIVYMPIYANVFSTNGLLSWSAREENSMKLLVLFMSA